MSLDGASLPRVPWEELEETEPDAPYMWIRWKGRPFTGVAVSDKGGFVEEVPFIDGFGHGRCLLKDPRGRVRRDYTLAQGEFVGRDRAWYADGRPQHDIVHAPQRRELRWNEDGVLVVDWDMAGRERREWYDDGALRVESIAGRKTIFAHSGQRLLEVVVNAGKEQRVFEDDAMVDHLFDVLADRDFWHFGLGFLLDLLARDRVRGVEQMRRVLFGPSPLAKVDVAQQAAARGVIELCDDLDSLGDDPTIPGMAEAGTTGRRGTRLSVGEAARKAAAALRRGSQVAVRRRVQEE